MTLKFHNMIAPVALGLAIALTASLADAKRGSGGGGGGGGGGGDKVKLSCEVRADNNDPSTKVRYEVRGSRVKFDASYEAGLTGGEIYLYINGTRLIGQTLQCDLGGCFADFAFDTNVEDGEPFPGDVVFFPISVGFGSAFEQDEATVCNPE